MLAVALAVPYATIQLTLTLYLVGVALAQLVYGPLSDRYGRKPLLLGRAGDLPGRQRRRGAGALGGLADRGAGAAGGRQLRRPRARPRHDPRQLPARQAAGGARLCQHRHGGGADAVADHRQPAARAFRLARHHAVLPGLRPAAAAGGAGEAAGDAGAAGAAAGAGRHARRLPDAAAHPGLPRLLRHHRLRHLDVLLLRRGRAGGGGAGARPCADHLCHRHDDGLGRLVQRHLHRGAAGRPARHRADAADRQHRSPSRAGCWRWPCRCWRRPACSASSCRWRWWRSATA